MMENVLVTMGDPAGIGPEITVKAVLDSEIRDKICPIVIGNSDVLKKSVSQDISKDIQWNHILNISDIKRRENVVNVIDIGSSLENLRFGEFSKETGENSFLYLKKATELITLGFSTRLVTAPISKRAWHLAGIEYPGHTEALADLTDTKKYEMIFANDAAKVVLATRHISLREVPDNITKNVIYDAIDIGIDFLRLLGIKNKRIGICSLNPHGGENGDIGREEIDVIAPVIKDSKYYDIKFYGPASGDDIFHKASRGDIDLVIAMYHDQGILPLKACSYYNCVNITCGLPFPRVSPGHGTAFDIAGKNIARPDAMKEALVWAIRLMK